MDNIKAAAPYILETPRLGFRQLCPADQAALTPILGDEKTMYAWEYGFSQAQITQWIQNCQRRYQQSGLGYCAAILKETGEIIGLMGLLVEEINGALYLDLGYILGQAHWGQGFATEGAQAWLSYAFAHLHASVILADIRPENVASRRVAQRLGMVEIGQHVKYHHGKAMPHLIYCLQRAPRLGRYQHYKGKDYQLLCAARHSETLEEMVVYRALYGECSVWVRPALLWGQQVQVEEKTVPRFLYIGE